MRGIAKDFPGVRALDGVDFELRAGEVHGLVGENGAGKSTLLKILSGALTADRGQILLDGHPVNIADPRSGRQLGISVIYQEFSLVPHLDVARNIFLGHERSVCTGFVINRRRLRQEARRILGSLRSTLDPSRIVAGLSVAEKQFVEIARALTRRSKILLMDEPSAPLSDQEVGVLFDTIRTLKAGGVTIVYVSHRMEELFQITDRISVLRDGRLIATRSTSELSMKDVVRLMVGREISEHYPKEHRPPGAPLLEVTGVGGDEGTPLVVRHSEVVGIAGLVGAGRTELVRSIFGADRAGPQRIMWKGGPVLPRSPTDAIRLGMGMVPEDRKEQGLILEMSVVENITLPLLGSLFRGVRMDRGEQRRIAFEQVSQLQVQTPSLEHKAMLLSGGNQQKVVLSKWLAKRCELLILDEPTRGIDVGAKFEMYKIMNDLVRQGKGVLMISSDLPELIAMSDRIYVMRTGRILAEYPGGTTDQETIMTCITKRA
jgi:ribose transport system ATP-binding protein